MEHLEALLYRPSCANAGREKLRKPIPTAISIKSLRDDDDALLVNWCELTVTRGKQLYKNAFATDHWITDQTVEACAIRAHPLEGGKRKQCTLKTKAATWNLRAGKQHLASLLATFNLLSLLFHAAGITR